MIILVFISVFIGIILKIFGILKGPLLFLLIILTIYLIFLAIKENKQNKGKRDSIFKPREETSLMDLLIPQLKNLKGKYYYKIIDNKIILANNGGIYLIFVENYKHIIEGEDNCEYLTETIGSYKRKVKNILPNIYEYDKKFNFDNIYLIVNNNCYFKVKTNIKIIKFKYFYYEFMKIEKKYTDLEVLNLYNSCCQVLSK